MHDSIDKTALSQEMRLLLFCLSFPEADLSAADVIGGCDWERFIRLTRAHRCSVQVHARLSRLVADGSPGLVVSAQAMVALKQVAVKIALCDLHLTDALCRIQELLGSCGIRVMCLKGPALSMLAYGNTTTRQYGDLDLMLTPADMPRAVDLLVAEGYRLREVPVGLDLKGFFRSGGYVEMENADRTIYLDLCAALISHVLASPAMSAAALESAETLQLDGDRSIQAPGPEWMMIAVCMHGAKDMWGKLGAAADVAALLAANPDADWGKMLLTAGSWGQTRSVLIGLAVTRILLGTALPAALDEALGTDKVATKLAGDAVRSLVARSSGRGGRMTRMCFQLRSREDMGSRWRWVMRRLFVPSASDMNALRVPQQLGWLRYALRPFRLLARLGFRGLRDEG